MAQGAPAKYHAGGRVLSKHEDPIRFAMQELGGHRITQDFRLTRRSFVAAAGTGAAVLSSSSLAAQPLSAAEQLGWGAPLQVIDPIRTELVMNLVVTCSLPERMGAELAQQGRRSGPILAYQWRAVRRKGDSRIGRAWRGRFPCAAPGR